MISVVIPIYNKAHTIVNTLNTVLSQTYKDFEVIIVNDGSTDNSIEVINQNFTDNRIRIINQENAGVSVARNRGVSESRGGWISFLDGDDEWHPQYLSIVYDAICQNPEAGMICAGGLYENKKTGKIGYRIASKYINKIIEVNFFENPCVFSHSSGLSVRKSVFNKTQGFPIGMKCCEDYTCTQSIAIITKTIYIGLPISKYNGGIEGQTTSIDTEKRYQYLRYVVDYYNLVTANYNRFHLKNETFKIYIKYDIRHRLKGFIKNKDERSMTFFLNNLSNEVLNLFPKLEVTLYRSHKSVLIYWINLTKLIWRLHNYPIVGENINPLKIESKYRHW